MRGAARAAGNMDFTSHVMADRGISYADDVSMSTKSNIKRENFERKHRFQCTFCFGKACAVE